jgi:Putative prokaryotic signal transducing protein
VTDLVSVAEASSEMEAAMICGYLESNGIEASSDGGGVFQPLGVTLRAGAGPGVRRQEILVRPEDAERARQLLAEAEAK